MVLDPTVSQPKGVGKKPTCFLKSYEVFCPLPLPPPYFEGTQLLPKSFNR